MALIICPECGKEFSNKASACPNCGYPISEIKIFPKQEDIVKKLNTGLGEIVAHENYVELIPLDIRALGRSKRIIYYTNISAISYRATSLTIPGYIQFVIAGTQSKEVNIFKKNWDKELSKDENSILIKYFINKKFKKECADFVDYLNSKI